MYVWGAGRGAKTQSGCMQAISGQYYSAQLRFFRQLCTAAKVDTVSNLARKMLEEGKCVVIGLQSTGNGRNTPVLVVWYDLICCNPAGCRQAVPR